MADDRWRIEKLNAALTECRRFLEKVGPAREDALNGVAPFREFSAALRASLDLSRALADLRKSPYAEANKKSC